MAMVRAALVLTCGPARAASELLPAVLCVAAHAARAPPVPATRMSNAVRLVSERLRRPQCSCPRARTRALPPRTCVGCAGAHEGVVSSGRQRVLHEGSLSTAWVEFGRTVRAALYEERWSLKRAREHHAMPETGFQRCLVRLRLRGLGRRRRTRDGVGVSVLPVRPMAPLGSQQSKHLAGMRGAAAGGRARAGRPVLTPSC